MLKKYMINTESKVNFVKNELINCEKLDNFEADVKKNVVKIPMIKKNFDINRKIEFKYGRGKIPSKKNWINNTIDYNNKC